MLVTASSFLSLMACTPAACRPMARTLFSLKRSACPFSVTKITSSLPLVRRAQPSWSPSSRFMAIKPEGRTEANSSMTTRLTLPRTVASMQNPCAEKSETAMAAVTRSLGPSARMLTSGMPLAVRSASGIWYTFSL
jgi:hypothetical protein